MGAGLGDRNHDDRDARIREGSATVFICGRPAARVGDASTCRGKIVGHAQRTLIGGATTSDEDADEDDGGADQAPSPLTSTLGAELGNDGISRTLTALAQTLIGQARAALKSDQGSP